MTADERLARVKQSEAVTPDTHATDMRELTIFLQMIIEQITLILQESGESMHSLTDSVTLTAANMSSIKAHLNASKSVNQPCHVNLSNLSSKGRSEQIQVSESIGSLCEQAESNLNKAVTAIQFYDRLSQRVLHIQENLHALSEITSAQQIDHTELWQQLHARMQTVYTLEQEHELYSKLLARLAVDAATLGIARDGGQECAGPNSVDAAKSSSHGDIELF